MKAGVYYGMSNDDYHSSIGISKSGLDLVEISPLHYWQKYLAPKDEDEEQKQDKGHFKLGTAIHTAILEPEEFYDRYILLPEDAPRKPSKTQREAKKPSDETLYAIGWWDDFNAKCEANGVVILDQKEMKLCDGVIQSVRGSRIGRKIFGMSGGQPEVSVYWNDPVTGVLCKCRPDYLVNPGFVLDVKSTKSAAPDDFMRSAFNYGYHMQAAWYLDGCEIALGERPDTFAFLALEKEPPYAFAWYFADDGMIEAGRRQYRKALETYARCLDSGVWPGYEDKLLPLSLPKWAETQLLLEDVA